MRRQVATGWAIAGVLALTACSGDDLGGDSTDGPDPSAAALNQEQTAEALLTEEEFPLDGYTRGEPVPINIDVAVLDASALLDSEELPPECRAAAELARLTLPPDAGTQVSFHSPGDAQEPAREITVIVFSTAVAVDYFGGYADQAEACGTVEEGGRTLEFAPLETEGVRGYTLGTDLGDLRVDLILAGRSFGANHAAVNALDLSEEETVRILDAQTEKLSSTG